MSKYTSLSVRKIAALSGLSTATVSRALNNSSCVSRETKLKIMKILEENGAAGVMDISVPRVIGVIAASTKSDYYISLLNNIISYFDDRGDSVITYFADDQKHGGAEGIKVLKALHVDGIIAISFQNMQYKPADDLKTPMIWIDSNNMNDDSSYWVTSDQYIAGKLAAETLYDKGCRKPIIITGQSDSPRGIERIQGFKDAWKNHKINFDNDMVVHTPIIEDPYDEGREAVMYYYTKGIGFDGIFVINDLRAIGAVTATKELGLKIPEDMKIVGYDGISINSNNIFKITSIQQNTPLIARTACEMMIKRLNGVPIEHRHIIVPVKLFNGVTA